jgi:hypothetical protein
MGERLRLPNISGQAERDRCGIEFRSLQPVDFWRIDFAVAEVIQGAPDVMMLECTRCNRLKRFDWDKYEAQLLETTGYRLRTCGQCFHVTNLRQPFTRIRWITFVGEDATDY